MSALEEAIVELAPNDQWEMRGGNLSGLTWLGPGPRPTDVAILAKKVEIEALPAGPAPLNAEEIFDMLKVKGVIADTDRPRPKKAK